MLFRARKRFGKALIGAGLFAAVILAYGVFAWVSAERTVLDAAEAEGRALLHAVATGIESNLEAARAGERQLAAQLFRDVADLDRELVAAPGRDRTTLADWVRRHDLRAAVLLDETLTVVAQAHASRAPDTGRTDDGPFGENRLARLEADGLARQARDAGLMESKRVVLGFGENPFGPRSAFLVGAAAAGRGGYVLLQQDARALRELRADEVVGRLLRASAETPGIAYLLLQSEDGQILAADTPRHRELDLPRPSEEAGWRQSPDGGRLLDVALPAPWDGEPRGHLRVGLDAAPIEALQERSARDLGVFAAVILIIGVGGLLTLGALERREAELRQELAQRERFASLGRLAGGVAHEIRSPLNALSIAGQRLRREAVPQDDDVRERFDAITTSLESSIRRLDATVEEFLSLGNRAPPPSVEPVDLIALVQAVREHENVEVELDAPAETLIVPGDHRLLSRSFANLFRNARQAAPGKPIQVEMRIEAADVVISISDQGPGLTSEQLGRVFEPFFTGRPDGSGLGLTLARDGVERHGGSLSAERARTGGASFVIRLPRDGATS